MLDTLLFVCLFICKFEEKKRKFIIRIEMEEKISGVYGLKNFMVILGFGRNYAILCPIFFILSTIVWGGSLCLLTVLAMARVSNIEFVFFSRQCRFF